MDAKLNAVVAAIKGETMMRAYLRNVFVKAFGRQGANKIDQAIDARLAAGEGWGSIWLLLLPFVLQIVMALVGGGGPIDWAALLQQILALLTLPKGDEQPGV